MRVHYALILAALFFAARNSSAQQRVPEMVERELADTRIGAGHIVQITDVVPDGQSVALRIGDGESGGGRLVADPYALRAPIRRALDRSEYTITYSGHASYSNGVYALITERIGTIADSSNTGTVTIATRYSIAGIDYTDGSINASVSMSPEQSVSTDSVWATARTNAALSGAEMFAPYVGNTTFACEFSDLIVWAWSGDHLLQQTNDARQAAFLVRSPRGEWEAIPRTWYDSQVDGHLAESWSAYPATNIVDLSWYRLALNPYTSITATNSGWSVQARDSASAARDIITVTASNLTYSIAAWSLAETNLSVWVEALPAMTNAPVLQVATNLITGPWSAVAGTTSTYPTQAMLSVESGARYLTYTITAPTNGPGTAYYRISAQCDPAAAPDMITMHVPVTMSDMLTLTPRATFPESASTGTVVWVTGSGTNAAYAWDGSAWRVFW